LAAAGILGLWTIVFAFWAIVGDDPLGGEPVVVVSAGTPAPPKKPSESKTDAKSENHADPKGEQKPSTSEAKPGAPKDPPAGMQTVTIIDGASGTRQDVTVPAQSAQPAAPVVDPKLLEATRHGQIPRVSLDGMRPLVAYARKLDEAHAKPNMPRIALVISGLGISASTTAEAIAKLPAAVSLAFAPYATDVERVASRARAEGHEVLLQIPMEPFDYPDNDPGPQTLLTTLAPEQNIDRMHWLMSRFQGYVGVANYMGSRFTASDASFAPVLREVSKRGLMYFDDGTSPRSLASQIAGANSLPFAKAHVLIDAVPTADEIDRALARLEGVARDSGVAVGVATALPASIARIAQWAKTIEARGFALVPISAAVLKPKAG
jgi:hypothetical protein